MPPVLGNDLDPRSIAKAIEACASCGSDHHIPLFQAVGVGRLALTALTDRLARPNLYALNKSRTPALILVGDDDYHTTGPLGWAATEQLTHWAKGALVHGTNGDRRSYAMAIEMAEHYGRLLLIETSSDAAEAWVDVLRLAGVPTILLRPGGGGSHPVDGEGTTA